MHELPCLSDPSFPDDFHNGLNVCVRLGKLGIAILSSTNRQLFFNWRSFEWLWMLDEIFLHFSLLFVFLQWFTSFKIASVEVKLPI